MPSRSRSSIISSRICAWIVTSSAVVGSSATISLGSHASAIAIITRWRIPPGELVRVVLHPPPGLGDADELEHLPRPVHRLALARSLVDANRLGDLLADGVHRVERRHRLLEDHRDLVAADALHLAVAERHEVAPLEHDPAPLPDLARRLDQPHDRERADRLAAAGLTDEAEGLAGVELEVDPVDGPDRPLAGTEPRPQVLDPQELSHARLAACRRRAHPAGPGVRTVMCRSTAAIRTSVSPCCERAQQLSVLDRERGTCPPRARSGRSTP